MEGKKKIRQVSFEQASKEDLDYSLSLSPLERLGRLEDLDILFQPKQENGIRLLDALESLAYDVQAFKKHNFGELTHFRIGEPPVTIDLINGTKGVDLESVFSRPTLLKMGKTTVSFISPMISSPTKRP